MKLPTSCIFNIELAEKLDRNPKTIAKIATKEGVPRRMAIHNSRSSRYYTPEDVKKNNKKN